MKRGNTPGRVRGAQRHSYQQQRRHHPETGPSGGSLPRVDSEQQGCGLLGPAGGGAGGAVVVPGMLDGWKVSKQRVREMSLLLPSLLLLLLSLVVAAFAPFGLLPSMASSSFLATQWRFADPNEKTLRPTKLPPPLEENNHHSMRKLS